MAVQQAPRTARPPGEIGANPETEKRQVRNGQRDAKSGTRMLLTAATISPSDHLYIVIIGQEAIRRQGNPLAKRLSKAASEFAEIGALASKITFIYYFAILINTY